MTNLAQNGSIGVQLPEVATSDDEDMSEQDILEWNDKPTFSQWLYYEREAKTVVGDAARAIYGDERWPHRANTLTHLVTYLTRRPIADFSVEDLKNVFDRYTKFRTKGGKVPVRRGGIIASGDTVHRGYLVQRDTVERIKKLASRKKLTQGAFIDTLVEAAWLQRVTR